MHLKKVEAKGALHVLDDLSPYAWEKLSRFEYNGKKGFEGVKSFLMETHGYRNVVFEPYGIYKAITGALNSVIRDVKHNAFIIVGRSGLDHIHRKGIRAPFEVHKKRKNIFWLNVKRESQINPASKDPMSAEFLAGIRHIVTQLPKKSRVFVFDDIIRTGSVMKNIARALADFARKEGKEPPQVIPLSLMVSAPAFIARHDIISKKEFKQVRNIKKLAEDLFKYINVHHGIIQGNKNKLQKVLRQEHGIPTNRLSSIIKKFENMHAPITGIISDHIYVNTLSHELSDTVEMLLERGSSGDIINKLADIVAERENRLEPLKAETREFVIMAPRTRV